MDAYKLFGWKVRKLRLAQKLTQENLVEKSGIHDQRTVSLLERGLSNPTLQTIIDAAYGLGVPISELFSLDGAPERVLNASDRATKAIENAASDAQSDKS